MVHDSTPACHDPDTRAVSRTLCRTQWYWYSLVAAAGQVDCAGIDELDAKLTIAILYFRQLNSNRSDPLRFPAFSMIKVSSSLLSALRAPFSTRGAACGSSLL